MNTRQKKKQFKKVHGENPGYHETSERKIRYRYRMGRKDRRYHKEV